MTYRRLLHVPGARPLFLSVTGSTLATSLQILALSVMVYRQTGSALWSSCAFAAGFMPQVIGGLLLASLADRLRARPVLVATAMIRAMTCLAMAFGHLAPAQAIGLVALVAVGQPLHAAVQSTLVSSLFVDDLYVLGRSVFTLISSGAQLLGLAIGGGLIATVGPDVTFAGAGAIYLVAGVAVHRITTPAAAATPTQDWRWTETWSGNIELLALPIVRRLLLSWWIPLTLLVGAEALVVAYAAQSGLPNGSTGLLLAAFPAGAALGDLTVARWLSATQRRRCVPWLYVLLGIALLPLAFHPSLITIACCFAGASAASAYQLGGQVTFLGAVPADRRGLAFGLFSTGLQTGQGVGPLLAGTIADHLGAAPTIALLGALTLTSAPFLARLPRTQPNPAVETQVSPKVC